jgi:hypothetical protein
MNIKESKEGETDETKRKKKLKSENKHYDGRLTLKYINNCIICKRTKHLN